MSMTLSDPFKLGAASLRHPGLPVIEGFLSPRRTADSLVAGSSTTDVCLGPCSMSSWLTPC
jgi:hypothetical protein